MGNVPMGSLRQRVAQVLNKQGKNREKARKERGTHCSDKLSWKVESVKGQDSAQRGDSYSFLDFTLDPGAERLVRGTTAIKLRPKSFQVLRYLVERPGRLVTRE